MQSLFAMEFIMFRKIYLLTIFLTLSSMATASQDTYKNEIAKFYEIPNVHHLTLLHIEGFQQTTEYSCGPATIMSLLRFYNMIKPEDMNKITEKRIIKEMRTNPDTGTNPQQMISWLQHHGFEVKYGENGTIEMLVNYLNQGIPVIVEWIDWGGHWELVVGYDQAGKSIDGDKDTIFFADPAAHFDNVKSIHGLTSFNPDRFNSMWFDTQYFKPGKLTKGIYIIATPKVKHATR